MRQKRNSSEIAKLVEDYHASGMSHRAFAEAKGVPVSTVSGWLRRSRSRPASNPKASPLVPVVATRQVPRDSWVRIDLPCGRRVEVPADIPRAELSEILAVVAARSC